ncbi:hypothetical protein I4F81_012783 [Pyropia yezoensis]|uniref:Uncharacterized protein n=1 Tax=Pyropia yezoensis TaxID=2788 RepID=A0ACC3CK46_PYRYE|nr:hypothetical protein I4F81_012783 [Neopyropia yezoensis]
MLCKDKGTLPFFHRLSPAGTAAVSKEPSAPHKSRPYRPYGSDQAGTQSSPSRGTLCPRGETQDRLVPHCSTLPHGHAAPRYRASNLHIAHANALSEEGKRNQRQRLGKAVGQLLRRRDFLQHRLPPSYNVAEEVVTELHVLRQGGASYMPRHCDACLVVLSQSDRPGILPHVTDHPAQP